MRPPGIRGREGTSPSPTARRPSGVCRIDVSRQLTSEREFEPIADSAPIRRVSIEKLAPTGEGIARDDDGVGFVEGALPGEVVDAAVHEVRRRFWRGRAARVLSRSADRVDGPHAGCAGCDWAHFDASASRLAKRNLFLETMRRIGGLPRELFGELPVAESPPGYRLRTRLHVAREDGAVRIGYFGRRTHRVRSAADCEALASATRALLPSLEMAVFRADVAASQVALLESRDGSRRAALVTMEANAAPDAVDRLLSALRPLFQGVEVRGAAGDALAREGDPRVAITVGGREFRVPAGVFFQANRELVEVIAEDIRASARREPIESALDAYAGVGVFAGPLLDVGAAVVSVEGDALAAAAAEEARRASREAERWRVASGSVAAFLASSRERFDLTVVDPPRAGVGRDLSRELARRTNRRLLYVSCEPATLARDLVPLLEQGFEIEEARLYDFFLFTHRVEALVTLARVR